MLIPWRVLFYRPILFGDSYLPMAYPGSNDQNKPSKPPPNWTDSAAHLMACLAGCFAPTEGGGRANPIWKIYVKFASFPPIFIDFRDFQDPGWNHWT